MGRTLKTVNINFSVEEFNNLNDIKNGKSWHDFILEKCIPPKKSKDPFEVDIGDKSLW